MVEILKKERGMTLLEIMLALAVLSMLMTMVSMSLSGTFDVLESVSGRGNIYYQAQVAMQRIREDLASAVIDPNVSFVGESRDEGGVRADSLRFVSLGHVVFNPEDDRPGPGIISYETVARSDEDGQGYGELSLYRSDVLLQPGVTDDTPPPETEKLARYLLADHLRSVSFSYLTAGDGAVDNWSAEQAQSDSDPQELPAAVQCTLEFWLDREEETFMSFSTTVLVVVGWSKLGQEDGGQ